MYLGDLSEEEKEEVLKDAQELKNKNLLKMASCLYKADSFLLTTDKACCMCGELEDIALLIAKQVNYIIKQAPETKEVWADMFEDMAKQIRKLDI